MSKPRQTKTAKVTTLLQRPSGTTVAGICKATGWQSHSVRAALTGLHKSGHQIDRATKEGTGNAIYRIIPAQETPS